MDQISTWFSQQNVSLAGIIASTALILGTSVIVVLVNRLLQQWLTRVESRFHLPYGAVLITARVVSGALWLITVLIVLDIWGIGIGGLWTLLVSAAAVIGVGFLATWTMVSNFTASFFLAVWRPFHLGNVVEIIPENLKGRVIDRNLLFTVLREQNGGVLVIPNNLFVQKMFRVVDGRERTAFELLESLGNPSPNPTPIRQEIMGAAGHR